MDDRFDRRELLLHLGDMLEAVSCLSQTGRPDTPVTQLAAQQESLETFVFLRMVAPRMTAAEFGARVASAFFLWPKELLEADLNRNALASTVQHDLFDGNPACSRNTALRRAVLWHIDTQTPSFTVANVQRGGPVWEQQATA
jgi:hypothetical protein